ncbi:MAG: formate--tetrahydrofolate ligase [Hyphomicrobiales bacterium]|nr:formate--tetrahydrofolate ligase [Hyphomicrobiales bacterium]
MPTDIEIARAARLRPIQSIADRLAIPADAVSPYGRHIAKVDLDWIAARPARPGGKLILVTAINPTPAGEGKTTTTVGLGDGLNRIGKSTMICLREPSLGPCFGVKGGAAGGGHAQIVPMEQINLHFTGDFHAITSAHNLLSALTDNHIYWGNGIGLDQRRVSWRRVLDMNDRSLRAIVSSLGGAKNGFPREDGFDITVASEVMAVFCLAENLADLEQRLGQMVIGQRHDKSSVTAADLKAPGAMAVLLKDAIQPNLVQTLEGNPAFVHGGPFANIAHGCNSVIATKAAMKLADYVVTEAGFGADLGAEKFFNIKCRKARLEPAAAVIVATVRALKMHGGLGRDELSTENIDALKAGLVNLGRHVRNVRGFGVPVVVAINHFTSDTPAEHAAIQAYCRQMLGVEAIICRHWADGSAGAEELAHAVVALAEAPRAEPFKPLYADTMTLVDKIRTIATSIYGAADIALDQKAADKLRELEAGGFGHLPICVAKTQMSFSADPTLRGAPSGHTVPVRDISLSAGAGFVVALCGDIMRMPGLPRSPAAERIHIDAQGRIEGLF